MVEGVKAFVVTKEGFEDGPFGLLQGSIEVVNAPQAADSVLVFGGDGTMLEAIRQYRNHGLPFYGFNLGHIGFLMNEANEEAISEIASGSADLLKLKLLSAVLQDDRGREIGKEVAFNDFYFERVSTQIARVRVSVDEIVRLESLYCDGVLVCTPAGSTAYNAAADGMVLPIDSNSIVVTGICPAVFHHWRTAQLPDSSVVAFEALETADRPVRFLADGVEMVGVARAEIRVSDEWITLGFSRSHPFQQKVLNLQFGGGQAGR